MNEWDRLRRQAERYQSAYPPGTRILLQRMGSDPRPVADNTRGTVDLVDDIGTIHCTFDNGLTLGIIPGEDSFRKLTEKELAEEQAKKASLDDQIRSASALAEGFHDSDGQEKLMCKVIFCRTGGVMDGHQFDVLLDITPKDYRVGKPEFMLDVDERNQAYDAAAKQIGEEALSDYVIASAEMVKHQRSSMER